MIKLKRYALLLAGLMLLSFAGCGTAQTPSTAKDNPSFADTPADVPSATEISDDIIAEESAPPVAEPEQPAITEHVPSQTAEEKTQETAPKENAVTAPPAQSEQPRENQPPRQTETPKPEEPKPTPPPVVAEMPYVRPSADEVEKAVAKYINEYRLVQGYTAVIVLPGLTEVARFRASQLITNFSHDEDIDACTVLKYGELVDMTQYGLRKVPTTIRGSIVRLSQKETGREQLMKSDKRSPQASKTAKIIGHMSAVLNTDIWRWESPLIPRIHIGTAVSV